MLSVLIIHIQYCWYREHGSFIFAHRWRLNSSASGQLPLCRSSTRWKITTRNNEQFSSKTCTMGIERKRRKKNKTKTKTHIFTSRVETWKRRWMCDAQWWTIDTAAIFGVFFFFIKRQVSVTDIRSVSLRKVFEASGLFTTESKSWHGGKKINCGHKIDIMRTQSTYKKYWQNVNLLPQNGLTCAWNTWKKKNFN